MVQSVTEFVEQRDHFIVSEQRRLAADRRRKIAGEVRNGRLDAVRDAAARDRIVHPRATALRRARVEIEVKLPDRL